jgi:hypothetical protein
MQLVISKYRLFFCITLFVTAITLSSFAQSFEGRIVYDMLYPTTMERDPATLRMIPKEKMLVTLLIKGDKMRMETVSSTGKNVNIFDGKAETSAVLTELNGQKTAICMGEEEMEEEDEKHMLEGEKPKATKMSDTKEIAGYTCKKEEITFSKKNTEKLIVFYTDQIKSAAVNKNSYWVQKRCKHIPGLALEYELLNDKNEVVYKLIATQVIAETLDDSYFVIPADYKKVNFEKEEKGWKK